MTEFAPNIPIFPDPQEVLRGALDKIREFLSPTGLPVLEIYDTDIALEGLRAIKDERPADQSERKVTPIPAEDPDEVRKRDRVKGDTGRHYHGGKGAAGSGGTKSRRPNPEREQR